MTTAAKNAALEIWNCNVPTLPVVVNMARPPSDLKIDDLQHHEVLLVAKYPIYVVRCPTYVLGMLNDVNA